MNREEIDMTMTIPGDWADFTGADFRSCFHDRFPEFSGLIDADGNEVGHDNMHHLESLLQHQVMVLDAGHDLASAVKLDYHARGLLVMGCLWHDIGKPLTRGPKERWVCEGCTQPHHHEPAAGCERCGQPVIPRTLYGYFGHAKVGSQAWWEIARRERMDKQLSCTIYNLIRWHSHVHDLVECGRNWEHLDRLSLLLSWADSRGRLHSHFDDDVQKDEASFQKAWEFVRNRRR